MANLPKVRVPPDLRAGSVGPWELDRVPAMFKEHGEGFLWQRGYWSGFGAEPCFWRLVRDGTTWMTTSLMEQQSHAVHLKHASGTVIVAGVGLGMYLYNLCRKPEVKAVIAIDIDEHIVEWNQKRTRRWAGGDKIHFVRADAGEITRTRLHRDFGIQFPDYLYVDIWSEMDPECAIPNVRAMQAELMPRMVGWWAQELSFVRWCNRKGFKWRDVTLDTFDRWCLELGMIVPERSSQYLRYCIAAAANTVLR